MAGMNARWSCIADTSDLEPVPAGAKFAQCLRGTCARYRQRRGRKQASLSRRSRRVALRTLNVNIVLIHAPPHVSCERVVHTTRTQTHVPPTDYAPWETHVSTWADDGSAHGAGDGAKPRRYVQTMAVGCRRFTHYDVKRRRMGTSATAWLPRKPA